MAITIAIVEDKNGTRESLQRLFGQTPGIKCVGAFESAEKALAAMPPVCPQVAIIDINLPGMNGIDCVRHLKARLPDLQVLMLTTYEESDLIFNSLRAGANGYLLKNMPAQELLDAVSQVKAGGAPMSMQIARKVVAHFHKLQLPPEDMGQLSTRENEILRLLAKGALYKEISEQLSISMSTVRTHIHSIYSKLHVQTRTEAVVKYLEQS